MPAKNGCPPKSDPKPEPQATPEPPPPTQARLHRVRRVVVGEDGALMAELVEDPRHTPPRPAATPEARRTLFDLAHESLLQVGRAQAIVHMVG